jgi:hypothetical protein
MAHPRFLQIRCFRIAGLLAAALASRVESAGPSFPVESSRPRTEDLGPLFLDGFETEECELWSASSNPLSAPDLDLDEFGDEQEPTVHCALPAGHVLDVTDCDDLDSDIHPGAAELCNGVDDDCDPATPDGADDPTVGQACDGEDGDFCEEGLWECQPGGLACSDDTPTNVEICNGIDDDCDGDTDEDIVQDTNPVCPSATNLGAVSGDVPGPSLFAQEVDERWYLVTIREDDGGTVPLTARFDLQSPGGSNFDLFVICAACSDPRTRSSTLGPGLLDSVSIGRTDVLGDATYVVLVEVRFVSATICGFWSLTVTGDVVTTDRTCD